MIFYSLVMLVFGYLGEAVYKSQSVLMAVLSTVGYVGILYEIWIGSAKKLANNSNNPILQTAFSALAWFVLVGWAIYPIGYMAGTEGGWLSGTALNGNMDIIYNLGDAINKIGFGLVIYTLAVQATSQEQSSAA